MLYCVVPENIHTSTTEGHWKFEEKGGLKGSVGNLILRALDIQVSDSQNALAWIRFH